MTTKVELTREISPNRSGQSPCLKKFRVHPTSSSWARKPNSKSNGRIHRLNLSSEWITATKGKWRNFKRKQGPRNFNETINSWKEKPNFDWENTCTFTNPQGGSVSFLISNQQDKYANTLCEFDSHHEKSISHLRSQLEQHNEEMIGKINLL